VHSSLSLCKGEAAGTNENKSPLCEAWASGTVEKTFLLLCEAEAIGTIGKKSPLCEAERARVS